MKRHKRINPKDYWYLTEGADDAIDRVMAADHRRTWDPRTEAPSLATLEGRASRYGARYARSRDRLLAAAGVSVRGAYVGPQGRLCYFVFLPGERVSDTFVRRGREIWSVA